MFVEEIVEVDAFLAILDDDLRNAFVADEIPKAMLKDRHRDGSRRLGRVFGVSPIETFEANDGLSWQGLYGLVSVVMD